MANIDNQPRYGASVARGAEAIDAGLRAHMIRVYNYMTGALVITGLVAWFAYQAAGGADIHLTSEGIAGLTSFGEALFNPLALIVLFFGTLGLVWFISFRINRLQVSTALTLFLVYSAVLGLFLSSIFLTYSGQSIARVFFITAGTFGVTSLWGYTTKRDLTGMGSFLFMGLIGIILASVVNMFFPSGPLSFAISVIGVIVFTGLTAYDTQKIKEMYSAADDGTMIGRKAVMGALSLYLDFVNLFLMLLRLFGNSRN
ncbi:MAG: Bax inhibitor-1/YccA family protein [Bauldia sp.]